ncbi:hypothetical protein CHS0354_017620 [Potamilus streckersoni]|uniref:PDZ domain-containing protein n=1 Tax=Potamilus streckersoni TaxID=2493646 RepID=A0AAE0VGP0_9BIVA|nr:hypothetical protein CHS0354_017620 [Potamilus streckersoni]
MFKCIPIFRACNRQVEWIDRRHCNLQSVPDDVLRYARSLEELFLDANSIRELPKNFFRLVQLRKVTLSDNEIARLPHEIAHLVNLVEFDVSRNDIGEIPENIKFCKNLQVLDISSNPLVTPLPAGLTQLKNITHLGLNDVSLSWLPKDIGSLGNLVSLELRENLLRQLPASMSFLVKLEILDLGCNELDELPDTIGSLPNLQELWLDGNDLTFLPPEMGNLKKLAQLDVSENQLDFLPEEIGGISSLTDLCLSQNNLESLPDGIGQLKKLSIIKVDQNRLMTLTPHIGSCENLEELILTENLLTELPITIGKLKKMTNFNVDRNRLTEIPVEIGKCQRLDILSMRDNKLLRLPQELGNLKELHVLDVSGNRLEYLPITVTNLNLKALWLSENQAQPMLKFQTDFDERTGQKVLTCFLLPQQNFHTESMENLLRGSTATEDSRSSWSEKMEKPRDSVIRFEEVEGEDDEDDEEKTFIRHDTPHPKELKARHPKFVKAKGSIDGHIIPHHEKSKEDQVFVPMRDSDTKWMTDEEDETSPVKEKPPVPVRTSTLASEKTVLRAPELETKRSDAETRQQAASDEEEPPESQPLLREVTIVTNTTTIPTTEPDEEEEEEEEETSEEEEGQEEEDEEEEGEKQEEEENEEDYKDEEDYSDEDEDETNKHVEKRVGFAADVEDEKEKITPLRRRDTPHHKKNKRIVQNEEAKEKVLEILAKVGAKPPGMLQNQAGEEDEMEEVIEEESIITIVREPGTGLGISIAGGKGSTPYKGNDESIFISRVSEDGPAGKAGIKVGDKLISVNGVPLNDADHYEAVDILKNAGNSITMVVSRETIVDKPKEVQPPVEEKTHAISFATVTFEPDDGTEVYGETITTTLLRDQYGLGFSVAGGRGSVPFKGSDNSIYISRIVEAGAAHRDGKLAVGDKIISINGVDLTDARHDQAVSLLTGVDREIKLVVYREKVVNNNDEEMAPPIGEKLEKLSQPRIVWNQADSVTLPTVEEKVTFSHSVNVSASPKPPLTSNPSPFSSAIPFSYTYPSQPSPPPPPPPLVEHHTESFPKHSPLPTSLPQVPPPTQILKPFPSPSLSPKILTTEWTSPPPVIQPPKFLYPGFSRSARTSASDTDKKTSPLQSKKTVSSGVTSQNSTDLEPRLNLINRVHLDSTDDTNHVDNSVQQVDSYHRMITETRATISLKKPDSNHVNSVSSDSEGKYPIEDVIIMKAGGPLGLSIVGGSDHSSLPFGVDEPGIFVSKIVPDGAASRTNLQVGDRILSVNGKDLTNATHQTAVMSLIAPTYEIRVRVRHDPPPKGLKEITIVKSPGEKLGMSIRGGTKTYPANTKMDEGIFISKIIDGGAVAKDGRLKTNQRILEVNGQSLLGATHQEAVRALRSVGDKLVIVICEGEEPESPESPSPDTPSSPLGYIPSMRRSSISSIDKEDEEHIIIKKEQELVRETLQWEKEELARLEKLHHEREEQEERLRQEEEEKRLKAHETFLKNEQDLIIEQTKPNQSSLFMMSQVPQESEAPLQTSSPQPDRKIKPGTKPPPLPPKPANLAQKTVLEDIRKQSRIPSAKVDAEDEKKTNLKSETLTFSAKKHFFEKEIHEQSTKSKTETKANSMTKEELLSRATDNISSGEEEFNQVLARMKSLEDDAIRAQAVIHKAQEMQMEISKEEAKAKASKLEPFEITFADDEGYVQPSDQNGDTKVEVTKRQIIELNLEDSTNINSTDDSR